MELERKKKVTADKEPLGGKKEPFGKDLTLSEERFSRRDAPAMAVDAIASGDFGGDTRKTGSVSFEGDFSVLNGDTSVDATEALLSVDADSVSSERWEQYDVERELGRGAFGKVTLVRRKSDGKRLVMKSLFISKDKMTPEEIHDAENEVHVLGILSNHPNVTTLVESFQTSEGYQIVMELANEGSLHDRIRDWWRHKTRPWEEREVLEIFTQLCLAMEHCHSHSILHRDIKPANIMLTKIFPEEFEALRAEVSMGDTADASGDNDGEAAVEIFSERVSSVNSRGDNGGDEEGVGGDSAGGAGSSEVDLEEPSEVGSATTANDAEGGDDEKSSANGDGVDVGIFIGKDARGKEKTGGVAAVPTSMDDGVDVVVSPPLLLLTGEEEDQSSDTPSLSEPIFLVKLGDFGLSRELKPGGKARTYAGTPHYISPEVVEGRSYDYRSDVWALGCCLYEMLMGKRPFDTSSKDEQKLRLAIAQGEYERVPTERCTAQLRRLVDKCLSYMAEDRPTLQEILGVACVRNEAKRFKERLAQLVTAGGAAADFARMGLGSAASGEDLDLAGAGQLSKDSGFGSGRASVDDGF